jgi:hypothetical protein
VSRARVIGIYRIHRIRLPRLVLPLCLQPAPLRSTRSTIRCACQSPSGVPQSLRSKKWPRSAQVVAGRRASMRKSFPAVARPTNATSLRKRRSVRTKCSGTGPSATRIKCSRHVRMNEPHPRRVTPSWSGDSVGHYEGDTLVVGSRAGLKCLKKIKGNQRLDAAESAETPVAGQVPATN